MRRHSGSYLDRRRDIELHRVTNRQTDRQTDRRISQRQGNATTSVSQICDMPLTCDRHIANEACVVDEGCFPLLSVLAIVSGEG